MYCDINTHSSINIKFKKVVYKIRITPTILYKLHLRQVPDKYWSFLVNSTHFEIVGPAFLAHTKEKVSNIVSLTAL